MIIDQTILDDLTAKAKASPRLRMAYDLRTTPEDKSQRMLNAIEPGTEVPVHRHWTSSETVLCIRGRFQELLYADNGVLEEVIEIVPGGVIVNVPLGKWHGIRSLETGTILMEAKDGAYEPVGSEDILVL